MTNKPSLSLEDISRIGEKFYTEKLKEKLEMEHMGKGGQVPLKDLFQNCEI